MLRDVLEGLSLPQKELSPKYFYDACGSELFEEITRLEEYYLTRTERALLERWMPAWVGKARPKALVELGAGNARKSRIVLDAMEALACGDLYVPVDVSGDFLHETAAALRAEYQGLRIEPTVADMSAPLDLPPSLPEPAWFALLGSTLGNFDRAHAAALLRRIARRMRPGDGFLMGVDLRPSEHKSVERLQRAYDDDQGITAEFNLNVLRVLNRELGCDFDLAAYTHRAFYAPAEDRIEMHLEAVRSQTVRFPESTSVRIEAGESIRTEISCKYDRTSVEGLFSDAGLSVERWEEDPAHLFALILAGTAR
jgi:L-histidine N-alpha-methyltransferase